MNIYIQSGIWKVKQIFWWSSLVQINPYASRPFQDHVFCPFCSLLLPSPCNALTGVFAQLRLYFHLQHTVSWPSSMASTHWEHYFVCRMKRACFEPSTWSPSMMMSECHLLAVPWKMCTMLIPYLCCVLLLLFWFSCGFFLFFLFPSCTIYYSLCYDVCGNSGNLCSICRTATDHFLCELK